MRKFVLLKMCQLYVVKSRGRKEKRKAVFILLLDSYQGSLVIFLQLRLRADQYQKNNTKNFNVL